MRTKYKFKLLAEKNLDLRLEFEKIRAFAVFTKEYWKPHG